MGVQAKLVVEDINGFLDHEKQKLLYVSIHLRSVDSSFANSEVVLSAEMWKAMPHKFNVGDEVFMDVFGKMIQFRKVVVEPAPNNANPQKHVEKKEGVSHGAPATGRSVADTEAKQG